ncbi:hypothetical protein [Streptomyces albidoflavus]
MTEPTTAPEPQDEESHGVSPELEAELQARGLTPQDQHLPWEEIKQELGL